VHGTNTIIITKCNTALSASLSLALLRMTGHAGEEEAHTKPCFMMYLTTKRRLNGTARTKLKSTFR